MPNNYLSVLNKHIIQVENKNVGLKVCVCVCVGGGGGGHKHTIAPPIKKVWGGGGHMPPCPPLHTPVIYKIACGANKNCVLLSVAQFILIYFFLKTFRRRYIGC